MITENVLSALSGLLSVLFRECSSQCWVTVTWSSSTSSVPKPRLQQVFGNGHFKPNVFVIQHYYFEQERRTVTDVSPVASRCDFEMLCLNTRSVRSIGNTCTPTHLCNYLILELSMQKQDCDYGLWSHQPLQCTHWWITCWQLVVETRGSVESVHTIIHQTLADYRNSPGIYCHTPLASSDFHMS